MAADEELTPYYLFTLTGLIGRVARESRTTTIGTVETRLVTAVWYFASLAASLLVALMLGFAFAGPYAVLLVIFAPVLVTWAATSRSRRGLQLTHLQRTFERLTRSRAQGMLVFCSRLYDPTAVRVVTVTPASVDVDQLTHAESEPVEVLGVAAVGEPAERRLVRGAAERGAVRSARGAAQQRADATAARMDASRKQQRQEWARQREEDQRAQREQRVAELSALADQAERDTAETNAETEAEAEQTAAQDEVESVAREVA